MWSKLDHGFFRNPKTLHIGQEARLLYLAGVCYCGDRLTDGIVEDVSLPLIAADAQVVEVAPVVARLVKAGLWLPIAGGHKIHDFFDFNPNARQIKARREASRSRTATYRAKKKATSSNGSSDEPGNGVTRTSQSRVSQRTNVVKESDSDSELRVPAPLPPAPAVYKPGEAREKESAGTLTLEPAATSPPASRHAANGEGRGARGGEARQTDEARHRGPTTPVPPPPAGPSVPAHAVPLRAVPKPHEVERAELEAHPLFAPLVELFGPPLPRDLPGWREDIADLDDMQALPEDVPRAAQAYTAIMGADATGRPILLTRSALVRHWFRCIDAASYPDDPPDVHDPFEAPIVAWARRNGFAPEHTAEAAP